VSPEQWSQTLPLLRYIALTYLVLFSAFQTAQTLVIPLFPASGSIGLGAGYLVFTFSSLLSPLIVQKLGLKYVHRGSLSLWSDNCCRACISASFILYTAWIASAIPKIDWLFVVACLFMGLAAGPVWVAHGVLLTFIACDM